VSVFRLTNDDLELVYDLPVYDQIANVVKVPTKPFYEKDPTPTKGVVGLKAGRLSKTKAIESAPTVNALTQDLIFILTTEFHCMLYEHSAKTQTMEIVSEGPLLDVIGSKREPPYSVFVGPQSKYIALMLYENLVKIIPLSFSGKQVQLNASFNIRIRHPEALMIMPLF
jgi:hypothetical protein